jgi:hypothetical protein
MPTADLNSTAAHPQHPPKKSKFHKSPFRKVSTFIWEKSQKESQKESQKRNTTTAGFELEDV